MAKSEHSSRDLTCMIVSGACVGFMTGLSVEPGISGKLLASLTTLIVGVTGTLTGIRTSSRDKDVPGGSVARERGFTIDPMPVMMLVVGILLGAVSGIVTRTHNLLGMPPAVVSGVAARDASVGGGQTGAQSPQPETAAKNSKADDLKEKVEPVARSDRGVLYRASADECSEWRHTPDLEVRRTNISKSSAAMRSGLVATASACGDLVCLEAVESKLCKPKP